MPRVGMRLMVSITPPPVLAPPNAVAMGSHTVSVRRRSGDTFSPVPDGGAVVPGEAIRYFSSGSQWGPTVRFHVVGPDGQTILEEEVPKNLSNDAWLDTVAPLATGRYEFHAHARTFPFSPTSHWASIGFQVDPVAAPPPIAPPKGGLGSFLSDIKGLIIVGAVLAVVIAVMPALAKGSRVLGERLGER